MKKINVILSAMLVAAMLFGSSGCMDNTGTGVKNTDTVQTTGVENTTEAAVTEAAPAVTATAKTENESSVTTDDESVSDDSKIMMKAENFDSDGCAVAIIYPTYDDGEHDAFDSAMRDFAVAKFNKQGLMPEDSAVYEITSCDIKYESEYFVSAVVTGQIINNTSFSEISFAYTVNADPRNGKIYLSDELVGDIETVKTGIAEGSFTQSYGNDGLMNEVTSDVITGSWRSDYGIFPDMYFTSDSFGIIAELPNAVGGYAGFEIPYADTGDMINPIAKGLCGIIVTTD